MQQNNSKMIYTLSTYETYFFNEQNIILVSYEPLVDS